MTDDTQTTTVDLDSTDARRLRDALERANRRYGDGPEAERAWESREAVDSCITAFGGFSCDMTRERAMQLANDVLAGALKAESDGHSSTARRFKTLADDEIWPDA
jgi:hypothetical protein